MGSLGTPQHYVLRLAESTG